MNARPWAQGHGVCSVGPVITYATTPFGDGPARHLDWLLAPRRIDRTSAARRAAAAFLLSGPPLFVLAAFEGLLEPLLFDFVAVTRYAIAVPLLVVAESVYVPQLCRIHHEFADGGFVAEDDRQRFNALTEGTERVLASVWTELVLVAIVIALTVALRDGQYLALRSNWGAASLNDRADKSLAGWWRVLVSHPLFLLLVLRTLVRLGAWLRTLWGISRLKLRLIPAHADLVGGLRFVTTSTYGFLPLVFIFGVLMASRAAQGVLVDGLPLSDFQHFILGTVITAVVAFAGPLLLFQPKLWDLKVAGLFQYGVLATRIGRRFEARWLSRGREMTEEVLEVPDFSATADLFGIVGNVRESRLFLLDMSVIVPLVITVLLPFVPVLFVLIPVDEILAALGRAVL